MDRSRQPKSLRMKWTTKLPLFQREIFHRTSFVILNWAYCSCCTDNLMLLAKYEYMKPIFKKNLHRIYMLTYHDLILPYAMILN